MARGRLACCCLFVSIGFFNQAISAEEEVGRDQRVCGPRCIQMILDHYGKNVDLIELIVEMQEGFVEKGCSIHEMQIALSKRGIHSQGVKTGYLSFPNWEKPMILHYKKEEHFVVLEEKDGVYAKIRDGINMNPRWLLMTDVLHHCDVVLLTSDFPIDSSAITTLWWPRVALAIACIGLGGTGILLCHKLTLFRKKMRVAMLRTETSA